MPLNGFQQSNVPLSTYDVLICNHIYSVTISRHEATHFTFPSLSFSAHPNDAEPLAAVLRSLAINLFLFWFLHHAQASVQLNLASAWTGNRPKEAARKLKIDFQVENRALPLFSPLHCKATDSSPHSWIFIEVSIWSPCWAKIRSQIKKLPTYFPRCHFTSSFHLFLVGENVESWLTGLDCLSFILKYAKQIHYFVLLCILIHILIFCDSQ